MQTNQDLKLIGEGSFSKIYMLMSDKCVAQKHMAYSLKHEMDSSMELDICFRFYHPNKIVVYDFVCIDGGYIMNMKRMTSDLHLQRPHTYGRQAWTMDEDQRIGILFKIITMIEYLHSENIVHADIKPENILVDTFEDGTIDCVLSDFGAALPNHATATTRMTSGYIPLENVTLHSVYTKKTDIWSLGVLILELFSIDYLWCGFNSTGKDLNSTKIVGKEKKEVDKKYENVKFGYMRVIRSLSTIPMSNELARDLVKRMLVMNMSDRITCGEALNHPLFKRLLPTLTDVNSKVFKAEDKPIYKAVGTRQHNFRRLLGFFLRYRSPVYALIVALELYCRLSDDFCSKHWIAEVCFIISCKYCGIKNSFDTLQPHSSILYKDKETNVLDSVLFNVYPARFRYCNNINDVTLLLNYVSDKSDVLPQSPIGDGRFVMTTYTADVMHLLQPFC